MMVNNFNHKSAHLQKKANLKAHYNSLLSNCNWLKNQEVPKLGPSIQNQTEKFWKCSL